MLHINMIDGVKFRWVSYSNITWLDAAETGGMTAWVV